MPAPKSENVASKNMNIGFSLNFADNKKGTRVTYCANFDEFLGAKCEISNDTQEIISKSVNSTERARLSQNLNLRFSLNFSEVRWVQG